MDEYKVVVNHEMQYSIWPTWKPDPPGWKDEGRTGTKQQCLEHIDKVWTDMRPLSLQKWMKEHVAATAADSKIKIPEVNDGKDHFHAARPPNDLVKRLLQEQTVQIIRYHEGGKPSREKLKQAAESGYILVKFVDTKGGSELGCSVKNEDSHCFVEWNNNTVVIHGRLKLDFTPLLVHATVDLDTFVGKGRVEPIQDWKIT